MTTGLAWVMRLSLWRLARAAGWLPAVWLIANSKNGISSHELARALDITQKSAWFMLHRIRLAMQTRHLQQVGRNRRSR